MRRGLASRTRALLPEGVGLPDNVWRSRHRAIVTLLWLHALAVPVFALANDFSVVHALVESAILPATALLARADFLGRRARTVVASFGLLSASAILVHLSGGYIEMHFHFFVMVAVVALYQDWTPFLGAVAYVFVHHGITGAIAPESVFNHPAAQANPWGWAGIHALFILGISVACLVSWLLNERTLIERKRAEERLVAESRIVERLHEVGRTLAADLDTQSVLQSVTDAATELTGAAFGAFFYNVVEDGEAYLLYTLSGAPREAFERFGLPRATAIFRPTFEGDGIVRLDDVTKDARYGNNAPHRGMPEGHLPVRSYLAVPVISRTGNVLGGLFFGHPEPARFTDVEERLVDGIAAHAAIALDNATAYEAERNARERVEAAQAGVQLLGDAGRILTSSLEVEVVMQGLADLVAERIADYCMVELTQDDRTWCVEAGTRATSIDEQMKSASVAVQATGERITLTAGGDDAIRLDDVTHADVSPPDVPPVADVDGDGVADGLGDGPAEHVVAILEPLERRGQVHGVFTVAVDPDGDRTLCQSLPLIEELARRVTVAGENAILYGRQRSVSETLQAALLPDRLPDIPGLTTAARYIPGGPNVDVGGDWYDVIQLATGDIAVTIGDVVGRGEKAAALMGQLRNATRAFALDGRTPSQVADRLNALLLDGDGELMATLLFGVLDMAESTFTFVNAGHLPPLLVRAGTAEFVDCASGVPLGAMAGASFGEQSTPVPDGAAIVLYTDGLVEVRGESLEAGFARLQQVAAADVDLDDLCSTIVSQLVGDVGAHDDAAVLVLRVDPVCAHLKLTVPSRPSTLGAVRTTLRRWLAAMGTSDEERFELLVAAGEACSNAVRHASGPGGAPFELEATANGIVEIIVRDQGRWRPERASEGGRGLEIMRALVDDVEVTTGDGGTEVRIRRRLSSPVVTAAAVEG